MVPSPTAALGAIGASAPPAGASLSNPRAPGDAVPSSRAGPAPRVGPSPARGRVGVGRAALGLLLPLGLGLGWEAAVRLGFAEGRLMPPPSRIADTLGSLAASGELFAHAAATLSRVASGFGLGAAAGIALGALSGASPLGRRLLDPSLQALRAIPSIA